MASAFPSAWPWALMGSKPTSAQPNPKTILFLNLSLCCLEHFTNSRGALHFFTNDIFLAELKEQLSLPAQMRYTQNDPTRHELSECLLRAAMHNAALLCEQGLLALESFVYFGYTGIFCVGRYGFLSNPNLLSASKKQMTVPM